MYYCTAEIEVIAVCARLDKCYSACLLLYSVEEPPSAPSRPEWHIPAIECRQGPIPLEAQLAVRIQQSLIQPDLYREVRDFSGKLLAHFPSLRRVSGGHQTPRVFPDLVRSVLQRGLHLLDDVLSFVSLDLCSRIKVDIQRA